MATPGGPSETVVEGKIVVVMGPTGVGKTKFINLVAERGDYGVSDRIEPATTDINWIRSPRLINGHRVIFVDTPGFDDTKKPDIEIVTEILESLRNVAKPRLNAILYLHRISDNRVGASEVKRLQLFVSSCGLEAMANVVFVTTMWDMVTKEVGEGREKELKDKFWAGPIAKGCDVKRFYATTKSALDILYTPLNKPGIPIPSAAINDNIQNLPRKDFMGRMMKIPQNMMRLGRKLGELSKWQNVDPASALQLSETMISNRLSSEDSLVIVMGLTGSGKSSFIAQARGEDHDRTNDRLKDKTFFVRAVKFIHPTSQRRFIFLDTPGFNSPTVSNNVIMVQVSEWLNNACKARVRLSSIVCLHRITDSRVVRPAGKDFELLTELCDQKEMPKIMLVTTMWSEAKEEAGIKWSNVLEHEFWKDMKNDGRRPRRFDNTQRSAWRILSELEGTASNPEESVSLS